MEFSETGESIYDCEVHSEGHHAASAWRRVTSWRMRAHASSTTPLTTVTSAKGHTDCCSARNRLAIRRYCFSVLRRRRMSVSKGACKSRSLAPPNAGLQSRPVSLLHTHARRVLTLGCCAWSGTRQWVGAAAARRRAATAPFAASLGLAEDSLPRTRARASSLTGSTPRCGMMSARYP